MSSLTALDLRLNQARVLWRHWLTSDVSEGFVREFSPEGTHVRISDTPELDDRGDWHNAAELRCVEVLETEFDFVAAAAKAKRDRRGGREDGEEWKDTA